MSNNSNEDVATNSRDRRRAKVMSEKNMGLNTPFMNVSERNKMIRLVYVSAATNWPTEKDLINLLEEARAENRKRNITGILLYNNGVYMQLLEGLSKDVHSIYDLIRKDH